MRLIVFFILIFFQSVAWSKSAHDSSESAGRVLEMRQLASATGQSWVGGQLYQIARKKYESTKLDPAARSALDHGLSLQVLTSTLQDEIETVAIGQGSVLYASAFPMPSQLPSFVERSTLRDTRSRDLWVMIQFKDGSRVNLIADLDPQEIESLYADAEKRVSRVNGFRVSRMRDSRALFEKLGRKKLSATRAKASGQGQIVVAEFELK
ncbi:MAG: hypothetical protein KDD39_09625 [Bdellovibrionales bacterium]|nr:hypothetical protein [Bdellovibrionales bacterium]